MSIEIGSRELHVYEKEGPLAGTVYGAPLITHREHSLFRQIRLNPREVGGLVLDIGSGDDHLGMELYRAGAQVELHRVNPALGPTAPLDVMFATNYAISERAQAMEVPRTVIQAWGLHHNTFPDVAGLPVADWIFSLYCYPTIAIECEKDGSNAPYDHAASLEALSGLCHDGTHLFLGPINEDEFGDRFEAALVESPFGTRPQERICAVGQNILHLLPTDESDGSRFSCG